MGLQLMKGCTTVATQLLIYESVVPVSTQRHSRHALQASADFSFARHVNSLPLTAVEFLPAMQEYPVVFAGNADAIMPAAILGLRDKENVFVDAQGSWSAKYIPAFARRYPFVFSSTDDGKTFTLCIDESYPGLNAEGKGERLFDDQGKQTAYVDNVLKFLQQYQAEFQRTKAFCNRLKELDLFEPMQAQFNMAEGARISLSGFMVVSREKLRALPVEVLGELAKNDTLELIYAHLHSMRQFGAIRERMMPALQSKLEGETSASPDSTVAAERDGRKSISKSEKEPAVGRKRQP
jgi:hypothetical protein